MLTAVPSLPFVGAAFFSFSSFFFGSCFLSSPDDTSLVVNAASCAGAAAASASAFSAFFLRFLLPGAFLRACVRPFSFSVFMRRERRAMSVSTVGRMGIMSFEAYGSLH